MKKSALVILMCGLILGISHAVGAFLLVDSGPRQAQSPYDWGVWWTKAKEDVIAGNFLNMRNGFLNSPGTTKADPYDLIVSNNPLYSKMLHWIYWLPGKVKADFAYFNLKWEVDWNGNVLTSGWVLPSPSFWEDYVSGGMSGVIGSFGFAWNAGTGDVDAFRDLVLDNQTYATGRIRYMETGETTWQYETLQVDIDPPTIPEPSILLLLGSGLAGLVGYSRLRFIRKKKWPGG